LNFEEFYRIVTHLKRSATKTPAKVLFDMIDEDGSELVSLTEFKLYFGVEEIEEMEKLTKKNDSWLKPLLVDIEMAVF
jgi:hypothetical protein